MHMKNPPFMIELHHVIAYPPNLKLSYVISDN